MRLLSRESRMRWGKSLGWIAMLLISVRPSTYGYPVPRAIEAENKDIKKVVHQGVMDAQTIELSQMLQSKMMGIDREKPEAKQRYLAWAIHYSQYRALKKSARPHSRLALQCQAKGESQEVNPFCRWVVTELAGKDKEDQPTAPILRELASKRMNPVRLAIEIQRGDVTFLNGRKEGELRRAIATIRSWDALDLIVKKVTEDTKCEVPALTSFVLGGRFEEGLPNEKFKETAIAMYEKAVQCASADPSTLSRANFRLALMHLWSGNCKKAEKPFQYLAQEKEGDYNTRALYWLGRCARQNGKSGDFEDSKQKLLKTNPISLHMLSLNQGDTSDWNQFRQSTREIQVLLHSDLRPELNPIVRGLEMLIAEKKIDPAQRILKQMTVQALGTEAEFRLYLSVLALRVGDNISHFRLMDMAFRENPRLITQSTLKLFFPLKRFQTLWQFRTEVDPYLVAALIRQESGFNEKAHSRVGAMGLMQLMPATARIAGGVHRGQLYDPETNIRVGVKYLSQLINRFGGDIELALAAYNAGPGKVEEWRKRYVTEDRMLFNDLIPFSETRKYVALIGRNYFWYLSLYAPRGQEIYKQVYHHLAAKRTAAIED